MSGPRGPHRQEMIASTIQRAVQNVLARGLSDPRIKGIVTVTGVKVTADMRIADVRVSIMPEEASRGTMHGLTSAAEHIRHQIADAVHLRRTPTLRFTLDESLKRQARIYDTLARERERQQRAEPGTWADPAPAPEPPQAPSDAGQEHDS